MRKHHKRLASLALAATLLLICGGCGGLLDEPGSGASHQSGNYPQSILTGEPILESQAGRRPVAVMINNLKAALPQYGISKAGVIYEALAEGGVTRLMAVFDSLDGVTQLGTVRSARPYFVEMAEGLDAVFIHAGASQQAYTDMKNRQVDHFDFISGANNDMYWRDKERIQKAGYEHSVFTSGERIEKRLAASGVRTQRKAEAGPGFGFCDEVPYQGQAAQQISVKFSAYKTALFNYRPEDGMYSVSQYGKAHMDALTGMQLAVRNVLVLRVASAPVPGDTAGRLSFNMVGSGAGECFMAGERFSIQWEKPGKNRPFQLRGPDGKPLSVLRGQSYICIVPEDAEVAVS